MARYFNAVSAAYVKPFEVFKEKPETGQIWVKAIRCRYDRKTGEGEVLEGHEYGRLLLTKHPKGYWYSKSSPLYRDYRFVEADVPAAMCNPYVVRKDEEYRQWLLALVERERHNMQMAKNFSNTIGL